MALDSNERQALRGFQAAVELMREFQSDISAQTIVTFLIVASSPNGSINMVDLADRLDLSQASVSRNVAHLSKINRKKEPGFDLVKWELDPADFRRKVVTLTNKGQRLASRLARRIQGDAG